MPDPHILIDDLSSEISFTVGASARDEFPFAFQFFANTDLVVTVADVVQTLTTDYTVTGVTGFTGGFDGGTVTLGTPVTNVIVVIRRVLPYERQSDFPASGAFQPNALNTELDKAVARDRQLADLIDDANDNVQDALDLFESVNGAQSSNHDYTTRTALIAATVADGITWVRTAGHTAVGDGGDALYKSSVTAADDLTASNAGAKHWVRVEPDTVNARTLGVLANDIDDDTDAWAKVLVAGRNKRIIMPAGVSRVTSLGNTGALTFAQGYSYILQGQGRDPNVGSSTVLRNTGAGHVIMLDNTGGAGDYHFELSHFSINNTAGQDGIHLVLMTNARLHKLWLANIARNGIFAQKCFNSTVDDVYATHNGVHGINFHQQANNVLINNCRSISNSRLQSGGANIAITGGAGTENLGTRITNCDFTAAGASNASYGDPGFEAYGVILQYCWSPAVRDNYAEAAQTALLYVASTSEGLCMEGNYYQDGIVHLDGGALKSIIGVNTFNQGAVTTTLQIDTAGGEGIKYWPQILKGGATVATTGAGVTAL